MKTGISVYDEAVGDKVGTSKIASWEAIRRTMTSRVVYSVPIFVTPAIFNFLLQKANLLPKKMGPTRVILECMGVGLGLYIAMPVNCALYP